MTAARPSPPSKPSTAPPVVDISTRLGDHELRSLLIAACGTVGSVVDFTRTVRFDDYGAAVAKSVSATPWLGRTPPRVAPAGDGMLNGIGIQNPGIDVWRAEVSGRLDKTGVEVWGSAVGHRTAEFATVAAGLEAAGVAAIEVNLSCPNLDGPMFALDPATAADVVRGVCDAVTIPVAAKLSPNAADIAVVAEAAMTAGASWLVIANTVWGAGFDVATRKPKLSGVVGGYSGAPIKPIALRCVWEVAQALPGVPIVGCGGVRSGEDVVEFLLAGASAVAVGTLHFAEPRGVHRIVRELVEHCERHGVRAVGELVGAAEPW